MTSNAGATIWGTRMYSGLSFVPDICDFRVSLIAAFSEFTPSTPSLTAEPNVDDSFTLNQMVQNQGRIQEIRASRGEQLAGEGPLYGPRKTSVHRGPRQDDARRLTTIQ